MQGKLLFIIITGLLLFSLLGCASQNQERVFVDSTMSGPSSRVTYEDLTLYGGGKIIEINGGILQKKIKRERKWHRHYWIKII